MIKKIKSILSFVLAFLLTAPVVVNAQLVEKPTDLPDASVSVIVESVMNWLLYLVGFLGVIGFAIAGILYLTAAGDDDRISKAKNAMLYSIIGVIVAIAGLVVLNFAIGLLEGDDRM